MSIPGSMRQFYLLQIGWRIGDLLALFTAEHKNNDFWEMLLHHTITLYLVVGSYIGNYQPIGVLIMIYHDIPDIGTSFIRVLAESKWHSSYITFAIYLLMLYYWIVFRNFYFPWLTY